MQILRTVPLDRLTPSRVWSELDQEARTLAARSLYAPQEEPDNREEANRAISSALRFRVQAVRKLPIGKRVDYLSRILRLDDSLASSLLTKLHLNHRTEMLEAFLDELEIPQNDGIIDEGVELEPIDPEKLIAAAESLRARFPADEIEIYLATLVAMDPEIWRGLTEVPVTGSD
jgi:hypothetical protein